MQSAGIVGAGIGGIAAAIRLARKGYVVTVHEANDFPGGKLSEIAIDGYRFDAGPSLFTMPDLVNELFVLCGERPEDHFRYEKLAVNCHYFYEDGLFLQAFADREKLIEEIATKTSEPASSIEKALANSKTLYSFLAGLFMFKSLHRLSTFFNKDAFRAYRNLGKMDFFRTMHQSNASFFADKRLVQLFDRYATYNGSNPYQAPATLNIIPHLEFNQGAFFPTKGMYYITLSLYELAKRQGVSFSFGDRVEEIVIGQKVAKGLRVNGEIHAYDIVVSNMDIVNTYRKLLPSVSQPNFLLNQPKSSSALIFYWGIKKSFDQLALHNIFFSANYEAEFNAIFKSREIYHDPTVYINITSKHKPDDAPIGHENWFTMINVPNNSGQDWDMLIEKSRAEIISKLSRMLGENLADFIACERILDPRTIESRTSSSLGALYGNSSNSKYAAFLRHANFSRRISGLYFCGGSVHPGGGIPLSLLSAKIMADQVR